MKNESTKPQRFLHRLGVFGFAKVEPLILAALVSEDPLLLIGKAGTGKTFLLNSISEALQLEHRHYNASFISFDDLIGFPYPGTDGKSIQFLPTPATIWEAHSVLVDELSRCKPETQNKFFSLIHERKVQGIPLQNLRYRWAAMNPFNFDGNDGDVAYEGSRPLDQALADRFAFIIEVPDWLQLSQAEQEAVIHPSGENCISNDEGELQQFIDKKRDLFQRAIDNPLPETVTYCRLVTTLLTEAGLRISPRRARLLARNITALLCVKGEGNIKQVSKNTGELFALALQWSIPQRAYADSIPAHVIESAHREAMRIVQTIDPKKKWVSEFHLLDNLSQKISRLFDTRIDKDVKSLAVVQMMASAAPADRAIFAFSTYLGFSDEKILNEEALNEMSKIAVNILEVEGEITWMQRIYHPSKDQAQHPQWPDCQQVLNGFSSPQKKLRQMRAKQFFLYLLSNKISFENAVQLEQELNACFKMMATQLTKLKKTCA